MQEADDPERGPVRDRPDELPGNTDKDYRDVAQPVKPAYGPGSDDDDYQGVGVTQDAPVDDLSDEAMDDSPDQRDPSVRALVAGGGAFPTFYVVALIGADWIKDDMTETTVQGCLDDLGLDDPPGAGLWLFTGKIVIERWDGAPGDEEYRVSYEGEYTRPMFHELAAFGVSWLPAEDPIEPTPDFEI